MGNCYLQLGGDYLFARHRNDPYRTIINRLRFWVGWWWWWWWWSCAIFRSKLPSEFAPQFAYIFDPERRADRHLNHSAALWFLFLQSPARHWNQFDPASGRSKQIGFQVWETYFFVLWFAFPFEIIGSCTFFILGRLYTDQFTLKWSVLFMSTKFNTIVWTTEMRIDLTQGNNNT